ncbi:MAG: bifunctional folylpolyglutamate synthase/dihydrofolate synthase [Lachnospiraceae bacterium]|nr:bifunctional folylpolyglutamate synthase/dihydrofolate synthase [Lachnospiraceae bacterium]
MTVTYQEAEAYIYAIPKFTKKNPPESTKKFYQYLENPGAKSKIIHIAGTNGKGSVCAYLDRILQEAGYGTAMFTSPHLVHMLERFRINNEMIREEEFLRAYEYILKKVEEYQTRETYHPTFFELLFFIGMVVFDREQPDFIILETGLGGRLDATNVIESPVVSVITMIGKDHCEYLGDTVEQIAWEKAGIIKQGCPLVYLADKASVTKVIEDKAALENSQTFPVDFSAFNILKNTDKTIDFSYESKYYEYIKLTLSTCAIYQCSNAALAIKAIEVIDGGRTISADQIRKAVRATRWAGRMEEIRPNVIVDGAHNEDGIEAFVASVEQVQRCSPTKNHLLFAVVNDKDYSHMVRTLMESQLFSDVTITRIAGSRELELTVLDKIFAGYGASVHRYEDVEEALTFCMQSKRENERLYIVGSLYLAGLVKEIIER